MRGWVLQFLSRVFGDADDNGTEASTHFFNVSNPFSGILTKPEEKLKEVIMGMGRIKSIYEAQFALLKEQKSSHKRLLVKFKDDSTVNDENAGEIEPSAEEEESFFSGLSDLVDRAVNFTGSETAAKHLAHVKELVARAKSGVKRMKDLLKKHKLKGVKSMFHGSQSGIDVLEIEEGFDLEDIWREMLLLDGRHSDI